MKKLISVLAVFCVLLSCGEDPLPQEEQKIAVSSVSISPSSVEILLNESVQLDAAVTPPDAEYELFWTSSDPDIATVDETGLVTAVAEGAADIYAGAGEIVASCRVTVLKPEFINYIDEYGVDHGKGLKIDGVVWAPVNCGYHADDFKYGKLYQWGRMYGQGYDGNLLDAGQILTYADASSYSLREGPVTVAEGNDPANADVYFTSNFYYYDDWTDPQDAELWNSGSQENPVRTGYDPCPEGWRVPTFMELETLSANSSAWTKENGQSGFWFTGSAAYSSELPQIFLPAGGQIGYEGLASDRGRYGNYWSSRPSPAPESYFANALFFYSDACNMTYNFGRAAAFSVRCVQE